MQQCRRLTIDAASVGCMGVDSAYQGIYPKSKEKGARGTATVRAVHQDPRFGVIEIHVAITG